jgi:site-specific recombinase XerD
MNKIIVSEVGFLVGTASELELTLSEYLISLRQEGKSKSTCQAYAWHLRRLFDWLGDMGIVTVGAVSRVRLREWGAGLYENWQPATIKQAVGAVRSFFGWCWLEKLIRDNPAEALKTPKVKKRVQRTVTEKEVRLLLDACNTEMVKGVRDQAIVSLLFDSGLRAAELCRLRVDGLNLKEMELKVIVKGGDESKGWFGVRSVMLLDAWFKVRMGAPGICSAFVAVGGVTPGNSLTPGGLGKCLRDLSKKAGIPLLSVHPFRRGFAVSLTRRGVQNSVLQDLGRWEDEAMIKQYTRDLQAGEIYKGMSPMDNLEQ